MKVFAIGVVASAATASAQLEDLGFEFVTIGDPGNRAYSLPSDRAGSLTNFVDGRGSVSYAFRMSKSEINVGQWVSFANRFTARSEELDDLLQPPVTSVATRNFLPGPGETYSVPAGLERAQVPLSAPQVMMYLNWLHNDRPSTVEHLLTGAYDVGSLDGAGGIVLNEKAVRQPGARFWIPTLDEYLKAAHYDPAKDGTDPGWWDYAHTSDIAPTAGLPSSGDVARGLTTEEIRGLTQGISAVHTGLPLMLYPDSVSPWGIHDLLGGRPELIDERNPFDRPSFAGDDFNFTVKASSDNALLFLSDVDRIEQFLSRSSSESNVNVHIVTLVPSPWSVAVGVVGVGMLGRRRG
ncbi:MAG: hypothetical protein CMJ31_02080 [Phycisphaerae bacterium]|nr:hypothetical protein [Phycisphaerae bacterium]